MKNLINSKAKILIICMTIFVTGLFQGCSFLQTKNPDVSEIVANIKKANDLSQMQESNKTKVRRLYSINTNTLDQFAFYAPKTNMQANELLILKVKDQDDIDGIQENIENRIEKQANNFQNYSPDQYSILENYSLQIKGKYVILVVSEDVDEIVEKINDCF